MIFDSVCILVYHYTFLTAIRHLSQNNNVERQKINTHDHSFKRIESCRQFGRTPEAENMNCETEMKFKFVFQYAFSLVVPLVSTYLIFDSFYSSFLRLRARTESTHTPPAHVLSSLIKFVFFGSICLLAHSFLRS